MGVPVGPRAFRVRRSDSHARTVRACLKSSSAMVYRIAWTVATKSFTIARLVYALLGVYLAGLVDAACWRSECAMDAWTATMALMRRSALAWQNTCAAMTVRACL